MKKLFVSLYLSLLLSVTALGQINVEYNITPQSGRSPISPYIYGFNWEPDANFTTGENFQFVRMGGNRATGYNWETNASNAGTDWNNSSDNFWTYFLGITEEDVPGIVATTIVDQAKNANADALITLQMAGYVSADKDGEVTTSAPDPRWNEAFAAKGSAFSLTPDLTDGKVYIDEFVNFLTNKYGSGGVKYALDNEPDLWSHTHPLIHPDQATCQELIDRSTLMANAVKAVDPNAETFGFVSYGFNGFLSFQNAPDWGTEQGSYSWFIDYYLDKMRTASQNSGKRLVDVLDLHWYPETIGDQRIINASANSTNDKLARLQSPRSFWDPEYTENSWIYNSFSSFMPLLPTLQNSIDIYNPGTKLAFTEFQFGGFEDITGALALTDALGIFGKYGVYAATHWDAPGSYGSLAYKIFANYDGNNSMYGDVNVGASMSDKVNSSIYASVHSGSDDELHVIVLNKSMTSAISGTFSINGTGTNYNSASVYAIEDGSTTISQKSNMTISGNGFTYSLPALSAYHFILRSDGPSVPVTSVSVTPATVTVDPGESTQLTAVVSPANATNKNVTWSSDNPAVATVSASGVVTGVAAGTVVITATSVDGGHTGTSTVTVTNVSTPVTGITVSPTSVSIETGGSAQLTATVLPANATNKSVTWSTANSSVATVSPTGLVMGIAEGSTTVTAASVDGGFTATASITVTAPPTACSNPVAVTLPFSKDGAGEFCYVISAPVAYINSWNMELVEINGVDYSNKWSNSLPPADNGNWYVHYVGNYPWSHFEATPANGRSVAESAEAMAETGLRTYPNPVKDLLHIVLPEKVGPESTLNLYDYSGKMVRSFTIQGKSIDLDMSKFDNGVYTLTIDGAEEALKTKFIKE